MSTEKITGAASFSDRLRILRNGRKKAAFAEFLGTSPQNYGRYESGRLPDAVTLQHISNRCGVTLDWLLGREPLGERPGKPEAPSAALEERVDADGAMSQAAPAACRIPADCDLPARLASLETAVSAVQGDLSAMRSQLDTLTRLLGGALRSGLDEAKEKAG